MSELAFKCAIFGPDNIISQSRAKNIVHPTLRYIQRVLAYTIFGRGETASVTQQAETYYLFCMLRQDLDEGNNRPNLGYFLARNLYQVATYPQGQGDVTVGGVITKIARAMDVRLVGDTVPVPTTLDLQGLAQMKLIEMSQYDIWLNVGTGTLRHELPLENDIDLERPATWMIIDDPLEPKIHTSPPPPFQQFEAQQGESSMDQIIQYMRGMELRINTRLDTIETRIEDVEEEAHAARYYAHQFCLFNPEFTEEPPIPPRTRRSFQASHNQQRAARQTPPTNDQAGANIEEEPTMPDASAMDEDPTNAP